MAKTKGALFSLKATGTLAALLTYQGRRHYRHVHKKLVRKDVNSTSQQSRRALFTAAVAGWQALTPTEKAVYNARSVQEKLPGYNIYISEQMYIPALHALFGEHAKFGEHIKFGEG